MNGERSLRMKVLGEQLRAVDKSISRLTAKRMSILDEIAKLDAEEGASERQTASRVARLSATTPKQAAGEIAMAKQVSAMPKLAEAHANGEISNGQLGAVAAIASASSESERLHLQRPQPLHSYSNALRPAEANCMRSVSKLSPIATSGSSLKRAGNRCVFTVACRLQNHSNSNRSFVKSLTG
jgi:chorismate mutase